MPLPDITLTFDPAPPWSAPGWGPIALTIIAGALVAFTFFTYRGKNIPFRRLVIVIALRLIALVLAILTVLRPALAIHEEDKTPSTLILALDASKSMTVEDEIDNKSRWQTLERILKRSEDALAKLRDDYNVSVQFHRFAEEVYSDERGPDGTRTDFGQLLRTMAQTYGQQRALRGLFVLSDGGDNGTRYPAQSEAARFRALNCPVNTFVLGRQNTSAQVQDLAITAAVPDPAPVPIKGKLTVRATIDSPGFENARVTVRLFIDGEEAVATEATMTKAQGNEVTLETTAPATPGEVKLTLKVDARPGEASAANNELSTYLTVTKEGISVLIVDRLRLELKFLRRALAGDPRFRVYEAIRQTDEAPRGAVAELYQFDAQAYDVIIIGDVTARRLAGGDKNTLAKIEELVRLKGCGLLMIGGQETFGAGNWSNTPVGKAMPVEMDAGNQVDEPVQLLPAPQSRGDYVMKLNSDVAASDALWRKLPALPGFSQLGRRKDLGVVIGQSASGTPLLVRQQYGRGRTAALALDMTYLWQQLGQYQKPRTTEGIDAHARFWRQLLLYLAQQEETEGSVWVKPDVRRISVGSKIPFSVGVRGKTGLDLPDAKFNIQVEGPDGKPLPDPVPTTRDKDADRGTFWKTEQPGEYRLKVKGTAKDADGTAIEGEAFARVIVFQDDTELLRPAADHDFMARIAQASGGDAKLGDELPQYLADLAGKPLTGVGLKVRYLPDWRSTRLGAFPPMLFMIFVLLLGLEWGLRRWWGMV
jgi:uncharacterized membrane protein